MVKNIYTKIFHSKTLQNLPKLGFLVWKQTIWQPCRSFLKFNTCDLRTGFFRGGGNGVFIRGKKPWDF
jgi:hypothetical protein